MTPEFSRIVALDVIGNGHKAGIEATAEECAALARRFCWIAVHRLTAQVQLLARTDGVDALGKLNAVIERSCVATGDPIRETIDEAIGIHFIPAAQVANAQESTADDAVELAEDELDVMEFSGRSIDIGEAVAQSLALAVAPYPRSDRADERLRASGVVSEGGSAAFSDLKSLLQRR
jgi:uncharacterized metal-binding protein YceD (DUF177 family)